MTIYNIIFVIAIVLCIIEGALLYFFMGIKNNIKYDNPKSLFASLMKAEDLYKHIKKQLKQANKLTRWIVRKKLGKEVYDIMTKEDDE